jgi:predicted dehydrogenase
MHVFVEKPLCIALADVDRIVALRDAARTVVQVGYAKRFDVAYQEMCRDLPDTIEGLRHISVLTYEPELSQYFRSADMVAGTDLPDAFREAARRETADQVAAAVGAQTSRAAFMFSEIYLGSLIHDVNLVHGLLDRMNEPVPCAVKDSAWWDGPSATASLALSTGARWGITWTEATKLHDFREQISLVFEDAVHTIAFPAPYLLHSSAVYERNAGGALRRESRVVSSYHERFLGELEHFHDCVTLGVPCRTPPEQARLDIQSLTDLFVAAGG